MFLLSCNKSKIAAVDASKVDVKLQVERFEQKFYNATPETLPLLKNEYPYLFPIFNHDSVWINRINDKQERIYFKLSQDVFGDFITEKNEITQLFKHVKHYHPNFKEPKIITLITKLDYQNKVMYVDSLLFVSLDMYLGKNNDIYNEFPEYIAYNFEKSQLAVDIAIAISEIYGFTGSHRQFLDIIISEGKKMYLVDIYVPAISDAQKMGYTSEKMEWATLNEEQVWKYFVEKNLLYSTDPKLYSRFISDAPFSKFYIDIDADSPGRIGTWLGWQIVRSYMSKNDVTLQQLMEINADELFKKSKYKPKK